MNSEKFRLLKTKRKEKKTNPRHRDAKITQKRDFETHKKRFRDFEIGQNFPRPTVFEVAFCSPTYWFLN